MASMVGRSSLCFALVLVLTLFSLCSAQDPSFWALKVSAVATDVPIPTITIQWPLEQCTPSSPCLGFTLYKRVYDAYSRVPSLPLLYESIPVSHNFTTLAKLSNQTYSFVDTNVIVGTIYEYRLVRRGVVKQNFVDPFGYLLSGIKVPLRDYNGVVLLVVESSIAITLVSQLQTVKEDLVGDGWGVKTILVNRNETASQVKAKIVSAYQQNPSETKAVYLFGRVPVPYSGAIGADMREDHRGAWPADVYYGDTIENNKWTDTNTHAEAANERNNNVPGDGKFDQSEVLTDTELYVGRVDLSQFTSASETSLLSRYVTKNHNFRHAITKFPRRAIIRDALGKKFPGPTYHATTGHRAFNVLFNATNVIINPANNVLVNASVSDYLFFYGCGTGTFTSMNGTGSTTDYFNRNPKFAFTLQYGEYFGDWDVPDNFLRAPLAYGSALTDLWAGSGPNSKLLFHYLGMGLPFGRAAWENQNVAGHIEMALMGDPTLRLFVVAPPSNVIAVQVQNTVRVSWTASTDTRGLVGYHVYRATSISNKFSRISSTFISGTSFVDNAPLSGTAVYMVKAVKLEVSMTGTYYNPSQGIFATVLFTAAPRSQVSRAPPVLSVTATRLSGPAPLAVQFDASATTASGVLSFHQITYSFNFGDERGINWPHSGVSKNVQRGGPIASHVYDNPGTYTVRVRAQNANGEYTDATVRVTVQDAAVVYAGTSTVCVSTSSNFAGCPSGAARQTSIPNPLINKRVLLRRGESFGSINPSHTDNNFQIGAYGTGNKPIISGVSAGAARDVAQWVSNFTIMDLDIGSSVEMHATTTRFLLYRNDIKRPSAGSSSCMVNIGTAASYYYDVSTSSVAAQFPWPREVFIVENDIQGRVSNREGPNLVVMGFFYKSALLGNQIDRATEHSLRIWAAGKTQVSHNKIGGNHYAPANEAGIRHVIKIHSAGTQPFTSLFSTSRNPATSQVIASYNILGSTTYPGSWLTALAPQNSDPGTVEGLEDCIAENNVFVRGPRTSAELVLRGRRMTARNNAVQGGGTPRMGRSGASFDAGLNSWDGPYYLSN